MWCEKDHTGKAVYMMACCLCGSRSSHREWLRVDNILHPVCSGHFIEWNREARRMAVTHA